MMIARRQAVIVTEDIPRTDLKAGDTGVVSEVFNFGEGYEVVFLDSSGGTVVVETLLADEIRPASDKATLKLENIKAAVLSWFYQRLKKLMWRRSK